MAPWYWPLGQKGSKVSQISKGLPGRVVCPVCRGSIQLSVQLPVPMWKAILFPAMLILIFLAGALQLDGLIATGIELTGPGFVIASAVAAVGLVAWFLSRKDTQGFYCPHCGYSE